MCVLKSCGSASHCGGEAHASQLRIAAVAKRRLHALLYYKHAMMRLWLQSKGLTFSARWSKYIQMAVRGESAGQCALYLQIIISTRVMMELGSHWKIGF